MICITFQFELGRFHANPWGANVNEALSEWPPSPWRILRALYATARNNVNLEPHRAAIDEALEVLMKSPPPSYQLPSVIAAHTRHFVPEGAFSVLDSSKRTKLLDGFLAMDREAELSVWWDATLRGAAMAALVETACRISYLGRSESRCSARAAMADSPDAFQAYPLELVEVDEGDQEVVQLLCPSSGSGVAELEVSIAELRKQRTSLPPGTAWVSYARDPVHDGFAEVSVRSSVRPEAGNPTLALFTLRGPARPALTEAVALGQSLRSAAQRAFGALNEKRASQTFSGRDGARPRTDQHQHAHYMSLPSPTSPRVDRLAIWAPEGFGSEELSALAAIRTLTIHDLGEKMPIALAALGRPEDLNIRSLVAAERSRRWVSVTPVGLVRYAKRRAGGWQDLPEEQIVAECLRRGLPEPQQVTLLKGSWARFRSQRMGQSRLQRASVVGAEIEFPEAVPGPVILGALSHYGLGVFRPES